MGQSSKKPNRGAVLRKAQVHRSFTKGGKFTPRNPDKPPLPSTINIPWLGK